MKYEDIKTKHNLTDEQWQHLQQLCQRGAVNNFDVQDFTDSMTVIGSPRRPSVHVRHTDKVLHMDLFDVDCNTVIGSSWALKPEGEQYAKRGIAKL